MDCLPAKVTTVRPSPIVARNFGGSKSLFFLAAALDAMVRRLLKCNHTNKRYCRKEHPPECSLLNSLGLFQPTRTGEFSLTDSSRVVSYSGLGECPCAAPSHYRWLLPPLSCLEPWRRWLRDRTRMGPPHRLILMA